MNTTENTYEAGFDLAVQDLKRFGVLHAMDKLVMLDSFFAEGYADAIKYRDIL